MDIKAKSIKSKGNYLCIVNYTWYAYDCSKNSFLSVSVTDFFLHKPNNIKHMEPSSIKPSQNYFTEMTCLKSFQ